MMRYAALLVLLVPLFLLAACGRQLRNDGIYVIPHKDVHRFRDVHKEINPDSVDIELLEWVIFAVTNLEREQYGLPPLRMSRKLHRAARQHSREMNLLGYFSHASPRKEFESLALRLSRYGVKAGRAAENIAIQTMRAQLPVVYSYPVGAEDQWRNFWRNYGRPYTYLDFGRVLVRRWMHSPGHRRNILNPDFLYLGVGGAAGQYFGYRVVFFTQNFSSTNW